MSLRKLCFFTMLATIVAFVAVRRFNVPINKFDAPTPSSRPHDTLAPDASLWYMGQPANHLGRSHGVKAFRAKSEIPPAVFLPVQSKNAKDLGAGKLLVASRDLGDPHFAETVVLLVHYDEEGVVGLILNRRTDVPLSRVLKDPKAAKDRSDKVYLGGPVETPGVFALLQSPAKVEGAQHIFGAVYLISTKASSNRPSRLDLTLTLFMFIWATPDGMRINCGRKWNWARGSFFGRMPEQFSIPIRIPCGRE